MPKKVVEHPFGYLLSIARVTDSDSGRVWLYYRGEKICCIEPQTKDYWSLRDILKEMKWEDFPGTDDEETGEVYLSYGDMYIFFDSYDEEWE